MKISLEMSSQSISLDPITSSMKKEEWNDSFLEQKAPISSSNCPEFTSNLEKLLLQEIALCSCTN